ncbi:hypothetical protein ACFYPN_15945 [Streptomyces sp. NPDC005576]|uniref:hypothetical protein n=1 Tax=Streptomyces sp. NPDC005576 TaxID=3364726 RepID=UPI0036816066
MTGQPPLWSGAELAATRPVKRMRRIPADYGRPASRRTLPIDHDRQRRRIRTVPTGRYL